ncbi:MAG: hypothetical protein Q9227_000132 [Pyrenula ochraceoflavens]
MSNIAIEDFAALSEKMDWSLFDNVFTSGAVGMRKPDQGFFNHVLAEIKIAPEEVLFLDDKLENVAAASHQGIKGIVFNTSTFDTLHVLQDIAISKGYEYLNRNSQNFDSMTDNGEAVLVPGGYFPDDLDTTSLALTVLPPESDEEVASMLDRVADHFLSVWQTYFDHGKPRIDEVVSANILACLCHFNRGHHFQRTIEMIHKTLLQRTYLKGTRYYPSPDCCLGFFARLLQIGRYEDSLQDKLGALLKVRLQERVGEDGKAFDLAMRVMACAWLGIDCDVDRYALLRLQHGDGGWAGGWMYRFGSSGIRIGNKGVTTAMAVKALTLADCAKKGVAKSGLT